VSVAGGNGHGATLLTNFFADVIWTEDPPVLLPCLGMATIEGTDGGRATPLVRPSRIQSSNDITDFRWYCRSDALVLYIIILCLWRYLHNQSLGLNKTLLSYN